MESKRLEIRKPVLIQLCTSVFPHLKSSIIFNYYKLLVKYLIWNIGSIWWVSERDVMTEVLCAGTGYIQWSWSIWSLATNLTKPTALLYLDRLTFQASWVRKQQEAAPLKSQLSMKSSRMVPGLRICGGFLLARGARRWCLPYLPWGTAKRDSISVSMAAPACPSVSLWLEDSWSPCLLKVQGEDNLGIPFGQKPKSPQWQLHITPKNKTLGCLTKATAFHFRNCCGGCPGIGDTAYVHRFVTYPMQWMPSWIPDLIVQCIYIYIIIL